jgi:hypothetical protein
LTVRDTGFQRLDQHSQYLVHIKRSFLIPVCMWCGIIGSACASVAATVGAGGADEEDQSQTLHSDWAHPDCRRRDIDYHGRAGSLT